MRTLEITFSEVSTKDSILELFSNLLNFPSYFGNNWDALEDCLCDLSWIDGDLYILIENLNDIHEELQDKLLEILDEVNDFWEDMTQKCFIEFKR